MLVKPKVLLWWSSGKDSAWAVHLLQQQGEVEVVALATTFNENTNRVAMHDVFLDLVQSQAKAAGLPLWLIRLPWPCTNMEYEKRMQSVIVRARSEGIRTFAYGDLHLQDIRDYREELFERTDSTLLFPIWGTSTETLELAQTMIRAGLRAILTCIDTKQLPREFIGREFDYSLLSDLPVGIDPCGENGEFHTFCYNGPMFSVPIDVRQGDTVTRDEFVYCDLLPTQTDTHLSRYV